MPSILTGAPQAEMSKISTAPLRIVSRLARHLLGKRQLMQGVQKGALHTHKIYRMFNCTVHTLQLSPAPAPDIFKTILKFPCRELSVATMPIPLQLLVRELARGRGVTPPASVGEPSAAREVPSLSLDCQPTMLEAPLRVNSHRVLMARGL